MRRKLSHLLIVPTLVILLLVIGLAASTMHASVSEGTSSLDSAPSFAAYQAACYTIDTSRPEWLRQTVYLPLVLKGALP